MAWQVLEVKKFRREACTDVRVSARKTAKSKLVSIRVPEAIAHAAELKVGERVQIRYDKAQLLIEVTRTEKGRNLVQPSQGSAKKPKGRGIRIQATADEGILSIIEAGFSPVVVVEANMGRLVLDLSENA